MPTSRKIRFTARKDVRTRVETALRSLRFYYFIAARPLREKRGHRGIADESHSIRTKTRITSQADCTPVANEISVETFSAFNPAPPALQATLLPSPSTLFRSRVTAFQPPRFPPQRDERKLFTFRAGFARAIFADHEIFSLARLG